jgi:hypothetical protein
LLAVALYFQLTALLFQDDFVREHQRTGTGRRRGMSGDRGVLNGEIRFFADPIARGPGRGRPWLWRLRAHGDPALPTGYFRRDFLRLRYPQLRRMQIAQYSVIAVRIERTTSWGNLSVAEAG